MVGLKVSVMHGKATKALMLENVTYQTLTLHRDFILETQIFLFVLKGDILERAQFFFLQIFDIIKGLLTLSSSLGTPRCPLILSSFVFYQPCKDEIFDSKMFTL